MNIKDVEKQTGIKKANIRYYENAGLIQAGRNASNNYREYTEHDIRLLNKIKFLRTLDISISDIKLLEEGELSLSDVVNARLSQLDAEADRLKAIRTLCQKLKQEGISFDTLDPAIAGEDDSWKESVHRIMQMDKVPGVMESRIGSVSGYALLFAGMVRDGDAIPADQLSFPLVWWSIIFLAGLAITLRGDIWLYKKYNNRFIVVDLLFLLFSFALTAAASQLWGHVSDGIPSVPALPALIYIVMAWMYKQRVADPGREIRWC